MDPINRTQFATLLEANGIKPRLRRELRFVPEEIADWQGRDFLAVMNRSRSEGVLIMSFDGMTLLPFRLHPRKANTEGRISAIICDLCMTWQTGSNSAVITFDRSKSSLSFLCCADLGCSFHVRDKTIEAARSRSQIREVISVESRINRLTLKLREITAQLT